MAANGQTIALTLVCGSQRADVLLPGALPVSELLPGVVSRLNLLTPNAATYGFDVLSSSGRPIDPALSLAAQHVDAGAVLTLSPRTEQDNRRYDDITEAVGTAVESIRRPWGSVESISLSVGCATVLCATAAAVLALRGGGTLWAILAGAIAAVVVALTARTVSTVLPLRGGMAMVIGACALLGSSGWNIMASRGVAWQALLAAAGIAVAANAVWLLPKSVCAAGLGPLVVAAALAVTAGLVIGLHVSWDKAAGSVLALLVVVSVLLPSLGVAMLPARHTALGAHPRGDISQPQVVGQVQNATLAITAIRSALGVVLVAASLVVAHTWLGVALLACCALSMALGARSLHSRIDVLINTISAFAAMLTGAVAAAWSQPWLALALCGAMLVAIVLLALHASATERLRAGLDRSLDIAHAVATIVIVPLAVLLWIVT